MQMFQNIPAAAVNLQPNDIVQTTYLSLGDKLAKQGQVKQKSIDCECPVCLEELDNGQELVYCQYSCGQSVHQECFQVWSNMQSSKTCVDLDSNYQAGFRRPIGSWPSFVSVERHRLVLNLDVVQFA